VTPTIEHNSTLFHLWCCENYSKSCKVEYGVDVKRVEIKASKWPFYNFYRWRHEVNSHIQRFTCYSIILWDASRLFLGDNYHIIVQEGKNTLSSTTHADHPQQWIECDKTIWSVNQIPTFIKNVFELIEMKF